ncbi:MAG: chemotaxis response regulator protein-glutamate methylesterase [Leptospirales bacterium]|nr:chemotaxis response regulator protein-glutamate methylesterase [Leptospirales bacterium]
MFRILLVDDSPLARRAVRDTLEAIEGLSVAAEATDGEQALQALATQQFDLIILDVEMPRLDGIGVLKEMQKRGLKTPTLMLSSLTRSGAITTFRALDLGAADFVTKPSPDAGVSVADMQLALRERVSAFAEAERLSAAPAPQATPRASGVRYGALLIGASTGGPKALQDMLREMPAEFPAPILIVQHMPPLFTAAFAERLNELSPLEVREACDGEALHPGLVLIAPGDQHLLVERKGDLLLARLDSGPAVRSHRPSFEPLLESGIKVFGGELAALIMTGMGRDGVDGLLRLRAAGGLTLAQDEASSVVFGMNRRAIEAGAIDQVVPLKNMVAVLSACFSYQ